MFTTLTMKGFSLETYFCMVLGIVGQSGFSVVRYE